MMFISRQRLENIEALLKAIADNTAYMVECEKCGCVFKSRSTGHNNPIPVPNM
jgi:uncharacterized Zn finger protein